MSFVVLYLWGDRLIPSDITDAVGLPPTDSNSKGQKVLDRKGIEFIRRTGSWTLQTTQLVDGEKCSDHVRFITKVVCSKILQFVDRGIIESARLSLLISFPNEHDVDSIFDEFDKDLIIELSQCKINLALTIFRPFDDDIEVRKDEQDKKGEDGPHRNRLREEENLLRQIR